MLKTSALNYRKAFLVLLFASISGIIHAFISLIFSGSNFVVTYSSFIVVTIIIGFLFGFLSTFIVSENFYGKIAFFLVITFLSTVFSAAGFLLMVFVGAMFIFSNI